MKNKWFLRILKFFALLLPIIVIMGYLQRYHFCFADTNTNRLQNFYKEEEDSLDVVLMGASEVFTGFFPGYAYDRYGYTSYPFAMDANPGTLYKSQLKEIMKHQDPQLLVVEINGFIYEDESLLRDEARLRIYTESMPMSFNRVQTILSYDYEDKISCIFPFVKYHGDWHNEKELRNRHYLQTDNENNGRSMLKGFVTCAQVDDQLPVFDIAQCTGTREPAPLALEHLEDFLSYCQENGPENILFVKFPHKLMTEDDRRSAECANRIGQIVREYGFDYLSLEQNAPEYGLDYATDFYNSHHLNIYGQQKLTDYLSQVILQEYRLVPRLQSDSGRRHWEEVVFCTEFFLDFTLENIEKGTGEWPQEQPWFMELLWAARNSKAE